MMKKIIFSLFLLVLLILPAAADEQPYINDVFEGMEVMTPSLINMVTASLPGFVLIGVLTVIVMFFGNLKGAIFRFMRRPKW
jgi:hypothetical protein